MTDRENKTRRGPRAKYGLRVNQGERAQLERRPLARKSCARTHGGTWTRDVCPPQGPSRPFKAARYGSRSCAPPAVPRECRRQIYAGCAAGGERPELGAGKGEACCGGAPEATAWPKTATAGSGSCGRVMKKSSWC